jgi:hypothetical protein
MFFFEKKNQKTSIRLHAARAAYQWIKVFLLLFLQKKKAFLPAPRLAA